MNKPSNKRQQLIELAARLEQRAHDVVADGTRHCGPVTEKEAALREGAALREEAMKLREIAGRLAPCDQSARKGGGTEGSDPKGESTVTAVSRQAPHPTHFKDPHHDQS